jgi:hypothetical protein
MAENFHLAPPSRKVDGLLAVPIDIESIDASFVFDPSTSAATAEATITYTVGPVAGNPIFDLRQTITHAWLDGEPLPVARLAHHGFGTGAFTDLRVIEAEQAAGSVHTLRVSYLLGIPDAQLTGSYLPILAWEARSRLQLAFGLSDLNRSRYVEGWLPANLIFDQYGIRLQLRIDGTDVAHSVLTNGAATVLGPNHWSIEFPSRFTALSPMLEVRPSDSLVMQATSVTLPVSGKSVNIEAWALTTGGVDLIAELGRITSLLTANELDFGPYHHEDRFVAFFNGSGGMEYDGGTTTSSAALPHEVFHSWFARGIKPASQADGWWDEGFTTFHEEGAQAAPLDFTRPPVLLCSRDPWQRNTPANAYTDGAAFWRGMAALLGTTSLAELLAELYTTKRGSPVTTQMIEEFLFAKSGNAGVVDAFHRFVYGLSDPSPAPELCIRDALDDPGGDYFVGTFWDSPDLWVRHQDDGGTSHQAPRTGQDNWLFARVRNKARAGHAAHFVVAFQCRAFAGSQFTYPADFFPCTAVKAEFDLAPGESRIVKARWPAALAPARGIPVSLLAALITRSDHPAAGRHVWEHNNLAQKNVTFAELAPGAVFLLPVSLDNSVSEGEPQFDLEVLLPAQVPLVVSLLHGSREFFGETDLAVVELEPGSSQPSSVPEHDALDSGGCIPLPSEGSGAHRSAAPEATSGRFARGWKLSFPKGTPVRLPITILPLSQTCVGLELVVPAEAGPANPFKIHLVQRNRSTRKIVAGLTVVTTIKAG